MIQLIGKLNAHADINYATSINKILKRLNIKILIILQFSTLISSVVVVWRNEMFYMSVLNFVGQFRILTTLIHNEVC